MGSPDVRSTGSAAPASAVRKSLTVAALAGGLLAATTASADPRGSSYHVWVDVLDVDPIVRVHQVDEPVERCFEAPPSRRGRSLDRQDRFPATAGRPGARDGNGGALIGGVVGGLLGNRLGDGRGRESEYTLAGALIGATIGASTSRSRMDHRERPAYGSWRSEPVRRCEVTWESRSVERVTGYEVSYRYAGRTFTRVVDRHPGDRMRVRVDIAPV